MHGITEAFCVVYEKPLLEGEARTVRPEEDPRFWWTWSGRTAERKGDVCVMTGAGRTAFGRRPPQAPACGNPVSRPGPREASLPDTLRCCSDRSISSGGAERVRAGSPFSRPGPGGSLCSQRRSGSNGNAFLPGGERMRSDWPRHGTGARRNPRGRRRQPAGLNPGRGSAVFERICSTSAVRFSRPYLLCPSPGDGGGAERRPLFLHGFPSPERAVLEWSLETAGRFP